MNQIQKFNFKNINEISVLHYNEKPYFFPSEIGNVLGYSNLAHSIIMSSGMIKDIDYLVFKGHELKDLKALQSELNNTDFVTSNQNSYTLITESGLYNLIFKSTKPDAIQFRVWVTNEVLPSIRKHGMYATPITVDQMLANPDYAIELLMKYKEERNARLKAEQEKAWIGSKREATAMATASTAIRKLEKANEKVKILNEELGQTKEAATILKVATTLGVSERSFNWRILKEATLSIGEKVKRIKDGRFDYANTYPAKAWLIAYNVDLEKIFEDYNL